MKTRKGQRLAILQELRAGGWVPLWKLIRLAAQYNARIWELRHPQNGIPLDIINRTERVNGRRHSWYRLVK